MRELPNLEHFLNVTYSQLAGMVSGSTELFEKLSEEDTEELEVIVNTLEEAQQLSRRMLARKKQERMP